ncbi:MAG: TRAP transporter small permease [Lautropia sp.]|nr:TRAP transporter small permease [Lautropia sp.]
MSPPPDSPDTFADNTPTRIPLKIEDWLTAIIMALLASITFINVVVRYFTSASFAWTEEISVFLMVVLTMVAGSAAFARKRHVHIELLARRGPTWWQKGTARFATAMVIVLFGMMTATGTMMVWDAYEFGETSPGIGVPQWWYTIWLPIVSAIITLRATGLYIRQCRRPGIESKQHPATAVQETEQSTP